jgi:hypothetical protein
VTTPRFQIRPLGLWGRPVTEPRAGSGRFRASWTDTVDLLVAEVEKLDGDLIVVQVDANMSDIRRDGMLYTRANVGFPGVKVSFESKHGPLTYATDAYDRTYSSDPPGWQANVRAIALSLQALRAVDRYGVTHTGEQYRGWSAITSKPAETDLTVDEARRVLADAAGVQPGDLRNTDAVRKAYWAAAKTAHPDAGGNADIFRLVGKARDVLLGGAS